MRVAESTSPWQKAHRCIPITPLRGGLPLHALQPSSLHHIRTLEEGQLVQPSPHAATVANGYGSQRRGGLTYPSVVDCLTGHLHRASAFPPLARAETNQELLRSEGSLVWQDTIVDTLADIFFGGSVHRMLGYSTRRGHVCWNPQRKDTLYAQTSSTCCAADYGLVRCWFGRSRLVTRGPGVTGSSSPHGQVPCVSRRCLVTHPGPLKRMPSGSR